MRFSSNEFCKRTNERAKTIERKKRKKKPTRENKPTQTSLAKITNYGLKLSTQKHYCKS